MTNYFFDRKANNFDFIRLVASLGVIYTHSFDLLGAVNEELFRKFFNYPVSYYGVRIFFIISGFLIVKSLIASRSWFDYFVKRVLRIFPGLIVVITLTIFLVGPIISSYPPSLYFSQKATYSYFCNVLLYRSQLSLPGFFEKDNDTRHINGSLWTLVYEFSFYILLFVVFRLKLLKYRSLVLLSVVLLVVFEWFFSKTAYADNYYPSVNIHVGALIEFAIFFGSGVLFHLYQEKIVINKKVTAVSAVCLIVANIYLPGSVSRIFNYAILPYLVFFLSFLRGRVNDFGRFGDYSYGFYIYAFPVQQILVQFLGPIDSHLFFLYSVVVSAPFAYFSWKCVEAPMLRLKKKTVLVNSD